MKKRKSIRIRLLEVYVVIMLLVFAILAILSSLYLVAQHKKIFGKSAL